MMQAQMQQMQQQQQSTPDPNQLGPEEEMSPEKYMMVAPKVMKAVMDMGVEIDMFLIMKVRHTVNREPKIGIAKVQTGWNEFCHIKVTMNPETMAVEILGAQMDKALEDPIEWFD